MAMSTLAKALGVGSLTSGLEKLTIWYEKTSQEDFLNSIEALFNPNEFSLNCTVTWETQYAGGTESGFSWQEFKTASPRTLTINLFFDTYEARGGGLSLKSAASAAAQAVPGGVLLISTEATAVTE